MKVHHTYRTRCFYTLPDGTFPMMLRVRGDVKMWQLPGGGIDDAPTDDPSYGPSVFDILDATIRETEEELGWNPAATDKANLIEWGILCRLGAYVKPGDPDYRSWHRDGDEDMEMRNHLYFIHKQVSEMPVLKLMEPEKFTHLVYVRPGHLYEDIPYVEGARFAHGIEQAYIHLIMKMKGIK